MKQHELTLIAGAQSETAVIWGGNEEPSWESPFVYREMADIPVQAVDPLEDLSRSVAELENLQARLRFMMREIRSMMKV